MSNDFQNRIDNLAISYISSHYDVSKMSVEEYIKLFNETAEKIIDTLK